MHSLFFWRVELRSGGFFSLVYEPIKVAPEKGQEVWAKIPQDEAPGPKKKIPGIFSSEKKKALEKDLCQMFDVGLGLRN